MSIKNYYRGALLLPVVLPLLALVFRPVADALPAALASPWFLLLGSLMIGGVPYLVFAGGLLYWMRDKPDISVERAILLSPLLYLPVLCTYAAAALAGMGDLNFGMMVYVAAFGLIVGYAYVGLAELGRLLLRPGPATPEGASPN